ncbi:Uncharacterised protein [Klebsiella pneumoniae subsp. ozaenae]|uniref:Uncharacterized protein n=1 Tax=Klebsiella pneumoniae subsp. ozaenae TaxID=574 RepID=A0A378UCV7_KLEPO|nr:Uncharacterised protein [Klebsiella pneumoniae subsp. ozaenae]
MKNKIKKSRFLSDSDAHYLVQDAENLLSPARRRLLRQGLTLGGIMMLTGCDISDNDDVEKVLSRMSRLNDRVQGFLFSKSDPSSSIRIFRDYPSFPV